METPIFRDLLCICMAIFRLSFAHESGRATVKVQLNFRLIPQDLTKVGAAIVSAVLKRQG